MGQAETFLAQGGTSRYSFVIDGVRRVDHAALHLPLIERELPAMGRVPERVLFAERDVRDIGALSLSDYASLLLFIWRFAWGVV